MAPWGWGQGRNKYLFYSLIIYEIKVYSSTFLNYNKKLISPTHKRTEGRAPCGALSLLQKDAALQGGIQLKPL
jgi:hypothetical protein